MSLLPLLAILVINRSHWLKGILGNNGLEYRSLESKSELSKVFTNSFFSHRERSILVENVTETDEESKALELMMNILIDKKTQSKSSGKEQLRKRLGQKNINKLKENSMIVEVARMKIGVLTFHSALNVGAVLQAYGLQTYLASLGHEVTFIDYQPIQKTLKARDLIGKGARATFRKWEDLYWSHHYTRNICFSSILRVSDQRYESIVSLESNPPDCDAYIAGSDQIWNFGKSRRF